MSKMIRGFPPLRAEPTADSKFGLVKASSLPTMRYTATPPATSVLTSNLIPLVTSCLGVSSATKSAVGRNEIRLRRTSKVSLKALEQFCNVASRSYAPECRRELTVVVQQSFPYHHRHDLFHVWRESAIQDNFTGRANGIGMSARGQSETSQHVGDDGSFLRKRPWRPMSWVQGDSTSATWVQRRRRHRFMSHRRASQAGRRALDARTNGALPS
jgi:hypothetical protein